MIYIFILIQTYLKYLDSQIHMAVLATLLIDKPLYQVYFLRPSSKDGYSAIASVKQENMSEKTQRKQVSGYCVKRNFGKKAKICSIFSENLECGWMGH